MIKYKLEKSSPSRTQSAGRTFLKTILFTIISLAIGCAPNEEGCLDIDATNFDVSADKQCENCCTYPNLKLNIFHSISTVGTVQADTCINHSGDSTLTNGDDNFFQVKDISFYLSDFQMVMFDGTIVEVEDTITLNIFNDASGTTFKDTLVKDDFVLVERSQFSYTIGEFRTPGLYSKISFKVGLDASLNSTNDTLVTSHPLSDTEERHFDTREEGYILQQFSIVKDTTTNSTDVETYQIGKDFFNTVLVELDYEKRFEPGFDIEIPIKVKYGEWMKGINFATDDELTIKSQIVNNTADAFEIDE